MNPITLSIVIYSMPFFWLFIFSSVILLILLCLRLSRFYKKVLSFVKRLLLFKPKFAGTPEMFLAVVIAMLKQVNNEEVISYNQTLEFGEVMLKIINVKLWPYKDFQDLLDRGTPDLSIIEKLNEGIDAMHQRVQLKKAIYGSHADLGDDDVMNSNSESAVFAKNLVKDMSKYVQFSEEEQKMLDNL